MKSDPKLQLIVLRLIEQGGPMSAREVLTWLRHHGEFPVREALWLLIASGRVSWGVDGLVNVEGR